MTGVDVVVGLVVLVGLVGVVVPLLPGTVLIAGAVLGWAVAEASATGWVVLGVVLVLLALGTVVKYAVPGRRLKGAGVPSRTLLVGGVLAVVGFFVVPVVGLVLGFVLGVYVAERLRVGPTLAWPSTKAALRAVGLSVLIELAAGLLATAVWVVGVVAT